MTFSKKTSGRLFSVIGIVLIVASLLLPFGDKAEARGTYPYGIQSYFPALSYFNLPNSVTSHSTYISSSLQLSQPIYNNNSAQTTVTITVTNPWKAATSSSTPGTPNGADDYGDWGGVYTSTDLTQYTSAGATKGFFLQVSNAVNNSTTYPVNNLQSTGVSQAQISQANTAVPGYFPDNDVVQTINLNPLILAPGTAQSPSPILLNGKAGGVTLPIQINNLTPGQQYYVRVEAIADNSPVGTNSGPAYSPVFPFTTTNAATNPPLSPLASPSSVAGAGSIIGDVDCVLAHPFNGHGTVAGCIDQILYYVIYLPSGWILSETGELFDGFAALSLSSNMYGRSAPAGQPFFLAIGWKTVRDVVNIFFIFALLYAAIRIIISEESFTSIGKIIPTIIITAILINFSMFIVNVAIDISNISARVFYNAVAITTVNGTPAGTPVTNSAQTGIVEQPLSVGITNGFNIQNIASTSNLASLSKLGNSGDPGTEAALVAIIIIFGIIINLVAASVFFSVALLFVGRIVGFYVAMLLAPAAFMSRSKLVPFLDDVKYANWKSWSKNLYENILMAPIFLFFIWLIIGLAKSGFLNGLGSAQTDFTHEMVAISIGCAVIIILLLSAKKLAQSMAGEFGGMIAEWINKGIGFVGGAAVGLATGGAALVGQATLGRAGSAIAESDFLKEKKNEGGWRGSLARLGLNAGDKLQTTNFDFRKTMAGKGLERGLTGITDVKLNEQWATGSRGVLKGVGGVATAGASIFTDKRVDFELKDGYKGATERGKKYREEYAESTMVTGQVAEDMDRRAKIWKSQYEETRNKAEEKARAAGEQFKEEEFKRAYESGADYVAGGQTFKGQKKILSAKEENDRRRRERADYLELDGNTDYNNVKKFYSGTKYQEFQNELQKEKQRVQQAGGTFNEAAIQQFLNTYKTQSAANKMLVESLNNKQQIDSEKFKNEYMKNHAKSGLRDKYNEGLTEETAKQQNSKFWVAGKFRENLYRQDFLSNRLNNAQEQAISGIRKKAAEETKQETVLSSRERVAATKAYNKANDELTKIATLIKPLRGANPTVSEDDLIKKLTTDLKSKVKDLEGKIKEHETEKEFATAHGTLQEAKDATKKINDALNEKKQYEENLKTMENKEKHEKDINDNGSKLGI